MNKIAIIITTFLRDDCLYESIKSILKYPPSEDYIILIGDQSHITKENYIKSLSSDILYYSLPFDCGLSYARNYLIKKAYNLQIPYCLIMADSIKFDSKYDFSIPIAFLKDDPRRGIIGFDLKERVSWEYNLDLKDGYFILSKKGIEENEYKEMKYIKCDIIRNFFLAKTYILIENKYDENLKMAEHEDFFWRLKNNYKNFTEEFGEEIYTPYQVFWTNFISASYIKNRPLEYKKYRDRIYKEFRKKLKEKYNLKGWIKYEK